MLLIVLLKALCKGGSQQKEQQAHTTAQEQGRVLGPHFGPKVNKLSLVRVYLCSHCAN